VTGDDAAEVYRHPYAYADRARIPLVETSA